MLGGSNYSLNLISSLFPHAVCLAFIVPFSNTVTLSRFQIIIIVIIIIIVVVIVVVVVVVVV